MLPVYPVYNADGIYFIKVNAEFDQGNPVQNQDLSAYAQSLTDRPMKGMLTGPVTIMAWSFVRDDVPRAQVADQLGLALRAEVADLEAAGIPVVQVDEPAIRETLPLRLADRPDYLDWSVGAFRLTEYSDTVIMWLP